MNNRTVVPGRRCPRCGSTLITDGKRMWCTFIGGPTDTACIYGLDSPVPVPVETLRAVPPQAADPKPEIRT